jgi:hypothetical protein
MLARPRTVALGQPECDLKARADPLQPEPGRSAVIRPEGSSTRLPHDGEQTWAALGSPETAA